MRDIIDEIEKVVRMAYIGVPSSLRGANEVHQSCSATSCTELSASNHLTPPVNDQRYPFLCYSDTAGAFLSFSRQ